jgi:hypothetical protein
MRNRAKSEEIMADALQVSSFWETRPNIKLGELTVKDFTTVKATFERIRQEEVAMENAFNGKALEREQAGDHLADLISRVRSLVRGMYGPDSKEIQEVGCIRTSDRKRPTRHPNGGAAPTPADESTSGE